MCPVCPVCQMLCNSARCWGVVGNKTGEVPTTTELTFWVREEEAKSKMIPHDIYTKEPRIG